MDNIDLLFSFDTTGSMYPCLAQVRRAVSDTVRRVFRDIPTARIGIIAHGDYCDAPRTITRLDFTTDQTKICKFVESVQATNGGDAPECYELVLHEARSFNWSAGTNKALVMIGDSIPHSPHERQNTKGLDWRNELKLLLELGVKVQAVQALNRAHATDFYREVARVTGGHHLPLNQFSQINDLILAVCYNQAGPSQLQQYEREVQTSGRMDRTMRQVFSTLSGRTPVAESFGARDLAAVDPGRFQVLHVDKDCTISDFVQDNGLRFRVGRGFYEFTKPVNVQDHKEIILQHKRSGDMFTGTKAREMLKLPTHGTVKIRPDIARAVLSDYNAFIQSTSSNRKLLQNTRFLYEVD